MRASKITSFLIVLIILGTVNCVSLMTVQPLPYESTERESKPNDYPIEIHNSDNIDADYKIIGEISIVANLFTSSTKMRTELLNEARGMGGDAIIDFKSNFSSEKDKHGNNQVNATIWTSKVIVWL
ncbi:MAG: hypothetical protein RLN81_11795 [Balneolaceae bacterium]